MPGELLGSGEVTTSIKEESDACRSPGVAADVPLEGGIFEPPANHLESIEAAEPLAGQLPGSSPRGLEERLFGAELGFG